MEWTNDVAFRQAIKTHYFSLTFGVY